MPFEFNLQRYTKGFKRCALFIPIPHLINCARNSAERHIAFQQELDEERERGILPDLSDVSRTVYAVGAPARVDSP